MSPVVQIVLIITVGVVLVAWIERGRGDDDK
jgi:hypothetical protein